MSSTILIVDDTETNIDILLNLLDDYNIAVATDGLSALEITQEQKIDLILLDIVMPEMDGYEVCKRLKANDKTVDIPIIFITAKTDEASIEMAYDVGGIDYVTKPFKPKELLARVDRELKLRSMIEHLEFIASHDSMTGIYNRRKFFELSELKFKNHKNNLYAIMIDIDKFKAINDSYGHAIGDKVIKKVTQVISEHLNDNDIFGRLGGEEFAIVCCIKSIDIIQERVELIRKNIKDILLKTVNNHEVRCTISSGIAYAHSDIPNLDSLLKVADDALYEAKNSGRNRNIFRV